jgi:hypothetical protein
MAESPETVVFLHGSPNNKEFQRVAFQGASVTMQSLLDEFGITSVIECRDDGEATTRGLAIRSPTAKLKKGGHYIVREREEETGRRKGVLFDSKVNVKEFRPSTYLEPRVASRSTSLCSASNTHGIGPVAKKDAPVSASPVVERPLPAEYENLKAFRIRGGSQSEDRLMTGRELYNLVEPNPVRDAERQHRDMEMQRIQQKAELLLRQQGALDLSQSTQSQATYSDETIQLLHQRVESLLQKS